MNQFANTRHYDVDWLRVLAFVTLIFYHIGMFYVADWGWHVKSQYQSTQIQSLMILVNQWRIPLIFFISGFALSMAEPKMSSLTLLRIRFIRLFIPLVIGMYVIVAPQAYYQAVQNSALSISFWPFFLEYVNPRTSLLPKMQHSSLGLLTWNHLWFLAYLWHYTLVYLLIKPLLTHLGGKIKCLTPNLFLVFLLPILIITAFGLWLKPHFPKTNALTDDWYNHSLYFSLFCFGYFAAKSESAWSYIGSHRKIWFCSGVITYVGILVFNETAWFAFDNVLSNTLKTVWVYTNMWSWLLAVVGFATTYLNRPSATLDYLNQAILPWYILHQSAIIIIAMNVAPYQLGGFYESGALIVITFVVCAVSYEVIRRFNVTRFMFGMKLR